MKNEQDYLGLHAKLIVAAWLILIIVLLSTCNLSAQVYGSNLNNAPLDSVLIASPTQDSIPIPQEMVGDILKLVGAIVTKEPKVDPQPIVKIEASKRKRKELKALNKDLRKKRITQLQYDILEAELLQVDIQTLQSYYRVKANMIQ